MTEGIRRLARRCATAIAALTAAIGVATPAVPVGAAAPALAQGTGLPGYCPDANGVTVIVDFQELGGSTIIRCAVGDQATGHAALVNAGISITGTTRWGEAFICRIEGKPTAATEPCIDTPPTTAYWSYWYASNGGTWTYSQLGAMARNPQPGSFEGWSFSLNRSTGDNPPPRVAPVRPSPAPPPRPKPSPASPPKPPAAGPTEPPRSTVPPPAPPPDTGTKQQPGPAHPDTLPASTPPAPDASPTPTPSAALTTAPPPTTPGPTGTTHDPPTEAWTGEVASATTTPDGSGVPVATLLGAALLAALTGAAILVAQRRRSRS